jgi:hypothetical protein
MTVLFGTENGNLQRDERNCTKINYISVEIKSNKKVVIGTASKFGDTCAPLSCRHLQLTSQLSELP